MINIIFLILISISNTYGFKSCIIFFTGGSNVMSINIYSDFLSHLESYHTVTEIPFKSSKTEIDNYIKNLSDEYDTITYLAHSSGATTAINKINPHINRLILLDPVATPNIHYNKNLNMLNSVNIINANLSYKWNYLPPFLPFIPILKLDSNKLNIDKKLISIETIEDYGHSDIIDNPYRNIMHYSRLSLGNIDRKQSIYNYHNKLNNIITNIIY